MNRKKYFPRGTALVYGLVIMTFVAITLTSVIGFVSTQIKSSLQNRSREQAFHIAESGIQFYRWYLAHNVEGKTAGQVRAFWQSGNPYGVATPYEVEYKDPTGGPVGRYRITVSPPDLGSTIVVITSVGWTYKYPNTTRTIQVRFRRPSWSEYIMLSNNNVRFGSGTTVEGKIFSNGGVHFDGVATNTVSSAVTTYFDSDADVNATKAGVWTSWASEFNSSMGQAVFQAGKQFPVATKDFTALQGDLNVMKSEAQASGRYFDNSGLGRQITLKTNGTFDVRTVASTNQSNDIVTYSGVSANFPIPQDGVIFVENNAWVSGTVSSKHVTIVAANLASATQKNLYIGNDIRYTNYDGRDILGLVGQQDIEIIRQSEDDLYIDGALLAQNGRVGRQHYSSYFCGSSRCSDDKTTITVRGAIASNQRYGFAWTDGTGYTNRNLIYDSNLLYTPPPFFPTGSQYKLDLWEER